VLYLSLSKAASFGPEVIKGSRSPGAIYFFMMIPIFTFYTWLFLAGEVASCVRIGAETKRLWNLKQSYTVLAGYVALFPFLWDLSMQYREAFPAQMTFHFVASLCGLYIVVRTSKLINQLELNRSPHFREYGKLIGLIFLSWIFPPLIWHVYNRFRRAIGGGSIPEHAVSGAGS
jgi:hypothetical protein